MSYKAISDLFHFQKKSNYKAGDGLDSGSAPFFVSSQDKVMSTNSPIYHGPAIIFGTGGRPSLHYCDGAFSTSADCYVIKPKTNLVSTKAIAYFLQGNEHLLAEGFRGAGLKHISKSHIAQIQVPDISRDRGEQIVQTLDKVENLTQKRQKSIQKLDELLQSVFYDMFGDPNGIKIHATRKLVDLTEPSGLVDGPFGSSVNTKTDYVDNGEIPVIRTKNVSGFRFIDNDLKFMSRNKYTALIRSQVLPGDIVLTKVGTIGNVCIFPETYKEAILSTTGSCRIRNNKAIIDTYYLAYYLHFLKPTLNRVASAGVQAFLNLTHIKNLDISVPPISLQIGFRSKAREIHKQQLLYEKSKYEIDSLFQSLLHQSFNGEVKQYAN